LYQETRTKIENLGAVNPTAYEEFQEAQLRQDFLTAQRQDLLDSIRDTEKAIQEIDEVLEGPFSEAFKASTRTSSSVSRRCSAAERARCA
jgi:chromosome segregation protein